jgi:hypothetical protein
LKKYPDVTRPSHSLWRVRCLLKNWISYAALAASTIEAVDEHEIRFPICRLAVMDVHASVHAGVESGGVQKNLLSN